MGLHSTRRAHTFSIPNKVCPILAGLVIAGVFNCAIGSEATSSGEAVAAGAVAEHDPASLSFLGLTGPTPGAWISEQPSSSMRVAQYLLPGVRNAEPAQLVVFYFGPGQGGTVDANIARWGGQFSTDDGEPVIPAIDTFEVAGVMVTLAAFHGTYSRGIGTGPKGTPQPDQTLLAAIVETTRGKAFIQLYGPDTTVNANRPAFERFLHSLRVADP